MPDPTPRLGYQRPPPASLFATTAAAAPSPMRPLEEVARVFASRFTDTPIVEAAHMELAMPDIAAAYAACVARGATRRS